MTIRSFIEKKIPIRTNCQAERNRLIQKREWFIEQMTVKAGGKELTGEELNAVYREIIG